MHEKQKTRHIKAAVCREFGAPLTIENVCLAPPNAGEVLVKINACAICHSDIIYMNGGWGGALPSVFGHEASGTILELGPGGDYPDILYPGAPVIVTLLRNCGACMYCENGRTPLCSGSFPIDDNPHIHGSNHQSIHTGLRVGSFAEEVVVHASQLFPKPDFMQADTACLLSCGVLTGFGAVINTAKLPSNQRVAVIGCGGVGQNCVQAAALVKTKLLVAIDLEDDKLNIAKQLGADDTINPAKTDLKSASTKLSADGFDYVFMAATSSKAVEATVSLLAKGGTLVLAGMSANDDISRIDTTSIANDGQRILGSKMGDCSLHIDIPKLTTYYRDGLLKLDELIGKRYPFSQINDAIASANSNQTLRNILLFD